MDVQVAALCDTAANYEGKLCLLGAFDTIWARQFPAVHPFCSIALRIVFRDTDTGPHRMKVSLIDDDGKNLMPGMEMEIRVALPENMFFLSQNFIVNLQQIKFDKPGQYSVDVGIDGVIIARIPLQVIQATPLAPPSGP